MDGQPVTSPMMQEVRATSYKLFGRTLDGTALDEISFCLQWLHDNVGHGPPPSTTGDVVRYSA